jgi:hypothetical protein
MTDTESHRLQETYANVDTDCLWELYSDEVQQKEMEKDATHKVLLTELGMTETEFAYWDEYNAQYEHRRAVGDPVSFIGKGYLNGTCFIMLPKVYLEEEEQRLAMEKYEWDQAYSKLSEQTYTSEMKQELRRLEFRLADWENARANLDWIYQLRRAKKDMHKLYALIQTPLVEMYRRASTDVDYAQDSIELLNDCVCCSHHQRNKFPTDDSLETPKSMQWFHKDDKTCGCSCRHRIRRVLKCMPVGMEI